VNKREELKKLYPNSKGWAEKVNNMPDKQVEAIFIKFKNENKLGR
jgi:hypothetical protein